MLIMDSVLFPVEYIVPTTRATTRKRVPRSGIKYVQSNFFAGRTFKDGDDVDSRLRNWQDNTANIRIHGTTRKVPREVFEEEERAKLKPLPQAEFKLAKAGTRKVYHDCHIFCDYNYYSVPFEYVGKEVEIEMSKDLLKVYCKGKEIAIHERQKGRGNFSTRPGHYPKYKRYSQNRVSREVSDKDGQGRQLR